MTESRPTLAVGMFSCSFKECLVSVHPRVYLALAPAALYGIEFCNGLVIMPRGGATAYGSRVVCHSVRLSVCLSAMHISSLAEN